MPKFLILTLPTGPKVHVNPAHVAYFYWANTATILGFGGSGEGVLKVKEKPDDIAGQMDELDA